MKLEDIYQFFENPPPTYLCHELAVCYIIYVLLKGESYGTELIQRLETEYPNFRLSNTELYNAIKFLDQENIITSFDKQLETRNRQRKVYRISPEWQTHAQNLAELWQEYIHKRVGNIYNKKVNFNNTNIFIQSPEVTISATLLKRIKVIYQFFENLPPTYLCQELAVCYILYVLLQGESYGTELIQRLETEYPIYRLSDTVLYSAIKFLEDYQAITGYWRKLEGRGRSRRMYLVSPEWIPQAQDLARLWRQYNNTEERANILNELGNAFLSSGEYKRAIDYFQQSLAVAREIGYISGQIASLINLGNAYYTRISGNRAEKIENSIAAYTSALQVCTRDGFLEQWAEIQYSLGNAYSERLNGNKTDNLELSIKAYNAALSVFTREAFPTQWAMTQYKLGNIYFNRIEGDKANKIEKTIAAYKAALKILTLETFPNEWARTQNNLGDIYCNRIRGDKASNIKKAIAAYKKALAFFTADTFPSEWARIQSSLGDAYFNKIQGDKAENLELAIACYQAARQVYTREAFPYKWADTCKNIGNAYTAKTHSNNLNYIDYLDNIEYAILFYQDALKIYTTYNFPDEFAIIREKLSEAHYLLEYYQRELEFASSPQPIIYNTPLARIEFVKRNLLDLDVDALVNPTGLDVSYGGSISFQLHERLGLELYNQLRQQPILRLGEVFVTDAGSLSAQYLIHTPTEVSRNVHTISSVGQGINAALLEAEKLDNVWTLAFPSIGSGAAGLSPATLATEILKITTNHLKKGSQLEKVIFAFVDEATYQAYIIAYQRLLLEKSSVVCKVSIAIFSKAVIVGEEVEISINLNQVGVSEDETYLFQISHNDTIANELNIILNAPGFQLNGDNTASLPLDPDTAQETQTARFHLTAFRSGNATITAEIFRGDTFETKLETQIQVADIDEATFTPQRITTQPRPVPQPDFILRIQTIWNETNSTYKFQYQLTSFRFASVFTGNSIYTANAFSSSWIEQTRGLLAATLENISGSLPTEGKSRLISLGQYLFGQIIPTQLQSEFRSLIPQNSTFTLLIVADQEAWIPWELLYDGQRFFGDRFIIGRWLQELNDTRPYEFPVGAVNVAHYANVEQPQLWATLLEAPGAPPPQSLPAGVLHDSTEAIRGLHLIRYSQSSDADLRNAPVTLDNINHTEDIEFQMRPAKLNLRRNRPFVTLSYVKTDAPELTALENTWASAFIRAGCSGFTGSLWAVEPAVEAAFISCFYNRLWAGASLSEAFYTSRQLARVAAPDSLDWLAYVLFGDPMARPYRPVPGDGYAIVEPIGREIDDPLPPGAIARFRVTLRRNPPVWHEDRVIEVAENLLFENLQVHIVTYGLQVIPDLPVTMKLTGKGDYLGWFTLVVPNEITDTSALVQVYFADGMRPIHSLNFSLNIENGREE